MVNKDFSFLLGKTQIWKTLLKTYQNLKRRPHAVDCNLIELKTNSMLISSFSGSKGRNK